jgi:hypothetical protein
MSNANGRKIVYHATTIALVAAVACVGDKSSSVPSKGSQTRDSVWAVRSALDSLKATRPQMMEVTGFSRAGADYIVTFTLKGPHVDGPTTVRVSPTGKVSPELER